jgi:glycerol-3-phosphate acyltransferase PlsY
MSAVLTLPLAAIAGLLVAYLLGSIPTGYLAGRLRGIDIRQHGSKSTGATNALRTLGKGPALVVLLVDIGKGVAAVLFAKWSTPGFSEFRPMPRSPGKRKRFARSPSAFAA